MTTPPRTTARLERPAVVAVHLLAPPALIVVNGQVAGMIYDGVRGRPASSMSDTAFIGNARQAPGDCYRLS